MSKVKVTLLTGRTITQGVGKEIGKLSEEYLASVAVCELDPEDLKRLSIRENENIRVATEFGSVVLRAKESQRAPHPGVAYIPYGLWANAIIGPRTHGTGMPSFKGVPAEVEPAPKEETMGIRGMLKSLYGK